MPVKRVNLLHLARKVAVVSLILFGIELVAFTIRIPGSGWTTFQIRKRKESMATLRYLSMELLASKEANGTLPASLANVRCKTTDGWDKPIRYWTDGQQFLLATTPDADRETAELTWPEHVIQTEYFELQPEIIAAGGDGPQADRFIHSTSPRCNFIQWPEGRNSVWHEGPFGLGTMVGNLAYRIENNICD